MITHNIKAFASIIIVLAIFTYGIIFFLRQDLSSIDIGKALSDISYAITVDLIIWIFFIKWGWKYRCLYPWLVPFPNLSGEWQGVIRSNWENSKQKEIPMEVSISQSFFHLQIKIKTDESQSNSTAAAFDIDHERKVYRLFYTYFNTSKANIRKQSPLHYGSAKLDFEGFCPTTMTGEYWTARGTTGEIEMNKL